MQYRNVDSFGCPTLMNNTSSVVDALKEEHLKELAGLKIIVKCYPVGLYTS